MLCHFPDTRKEEPIPAPEVHTHALITLIEVHGFVDTVVCDGCLVAAPSNKLNPFFSVGFAPCSCPLLSGNLHEAKTNFELALGLNANYEKAKSWQRKVSQWAEETIPQFEVRKRAGGGGFCREMSTSGK